jgi:hypothetical protein
MPERRKFSPQFRAEAVQMVVETGKPQTYSLRAGLPNRTKPSPTTRPAQQLDQKPEPLSKILDAAQTSPIDGVRYLDRQVPGPCFNASRRPTAWRDHHASLRRALKLGVDSLGEDRR